VGRRNASPRQVRFMDLAARVPAQALLADPLALASSFASPGAASRSHLPGRPDRQPRQTVGAPIAPIPFRYPLPAVDPLPDGADIVPTQDEAISGHGDGYPFALRSISWH
jgi:hypothetical protein